MLKFPCKLHQLLCTVEQFRLCHIVSWTTDGSAFTIHDRTKFISKLLPCWFHSSKWTSFQRQLNLYQFKRIEFNGVNMYFHQFFHRQDPGSVVKIRRLSNTTRSSINIINDVSEDRCASEMQEDEICPCGEQQKRSDVSNDEYRIFSPIISTNHEIFPSFLFDIHQASSYQGSGTQPSPSQQVLSSSTQFQPSNFLSVLLNRIYEQNLSKLNNSLILSLTDTISRYDSFPLLHSFTLQGLPLVLTNFDYLPGIASSTNPIEGNSASINASENIDNSLLLARLRCMGL